jgi:hypothetical protein
MVAGGFPAFLHQTAKRVALRFSELSQALGHVIAVPERLGAAGQLAVAQDVERLDQDDDPGGQRHAQQQQHHAAGDPVALRPDVDQTELRIHENS